MTVTLTSLQAQAILAARAEQRRRKLIAESRIDPEAAWRMELQALARMPGETDDEWHARRRARYVDHSAAMRAFCDGIWIYQARAKQVLPGGDWRISLNLAGRGFGKTRQGAEAVIEHAFMNPNARIGLVGRTVADVIGVMVAGESGILAKSPNWFRPIHIAGRRLLKWPNGAIAETFSSEEPKQLRGPQFSFGWADELCSWEYPEAWDMFQFTLRLGEHPRVLVTTTPKPSDLLKRLLKDPNTIVIRGATSENPALPASFRKELYDKYGGTRLGRQELEGHVLDEVVGALWTHAMIESARVVKAPETLLRIIVAVDPAVSNNENSDETGIVVVASDDQGHFYVLADYSGKYSALEWATKAVWAYNEWEADLIVAEVNNGGDLVERSVRAVDENVNYEAVRATRGKVIRAEPISGLYEQSRVHHVGMFEELENQMTGWSPLAKTSVSPDRLDALVWGLAEMIDDGQGVDDSDHEANPQKPVLEQLTGTDW